MHVEPQLPLTPWHVAEVRQVPVQAEPEVTAQGPQAELTLVPADLPHGCPTLMVCAVGVHGATGVAAYQHCPPHCRPATYIERPSA